MDESVIPFLGLLTQWLGGKEVLIEEVGIPSSNTFKGEKVVSEEIAYSYYERLIQKIRRYPFLGVFFWCYGDYSKALWEKPPLDEAPHERYFGLFREDRTPKSFLPLFSLFRIEDRKEEMKFEWIEIEPEDYFLNPKEHLSRPFWRFKEQES